MLILSRRENQSIVFIVEGVEFKLHVNQIKGRSSGGGCVKLAIEGDEGKVHAWRAEILPEKREDIRRGKHGN